MLVVDRLNRAADYDDAVCGRHTFGFYHCRCLRVGLSKGAQAEYTSHCEQKHVFQNSSYWQNSAVLH
jgi:hypothetical protein